MEILRIYTEEQLLIKYYVIKQFNIAKSPKYDGYQRCLAKIYKFYKNRFINFSIKSLLVEVLKVKLCQTSNYQKNYKSIIRKFEKGKAYPSFKEKFGGADLADMQLISKFNKGFLFLLCIIDIFSKY